MNWKQLMEKARQLVHDAKKLMDENQGEKWTQETQTQIDALLAESDQLKARAEQMRRVETGLTYFDAPAGTPPPMTGDVPPGEAGRGETGDPEIDAVAVNAEYRSAFTIYLRGGMRMLNSKQLDVLQRGFVEQPEKKVLTGNTGVEGGFLIPADFRAVMVEELAARAFLRNLVTVMPTSGEFLEMPVVEGPSSNAGIYANGIV